MLKKQLQKLLNKYLVIKYKLAAIVKMIVIIVDLEKAI